MTSGKTEIGGVANCELLMEQYHPPPLNKNLKIMGSSGSWDASLEIRKRTSLKQKNENILKKATVIEEEKQYANSLFNSVAEGLIVIDRKLKVIFHINKLIIFVLFNELIKCFFTVQ